MATRRPESLVGLRVSAINRLSKVASDGVIVYCRLALTLATERTNAIPVVRARGAVADRAAVH
jgi:hypothetical protein